MSGRQAVLCSIFMAGLGFAQSPLNTTIQMKLDRNAVVGSIPLSPGEYTVRQVNSANNARVLEFTTDRGTKLAATVTAIPLLQNTPPSETKVIFDNEGGTARISKILVQGKDYGYEFPKEYSFAQPAVAATMQLRYDVPGANVAEARTTEPPVAQTQPSPAQNSTTVVVVQPTPQQEPVQTAQNTPQQQPQAQPQQPAPQAAPAPAQQPAAAQPNAERSANVPATALGWADILLLGLVMAAAGLLMLRRTA